MGLGNELLVDLLILEGVEFVCCLYLTSNTAATTTDTLCGDEYLVS